MLKRNFVLAFVGLSFFLASRSEAALIVSQGPTQPVLPAPIYSTGSFNPGALSAIGLTITAASPGNWTDTNAGGNFPEYVEGQRIETVPGTTLTFSFSPPNNQPVTAAVFGLVSSVTGNTFTVATSNGGNPIATYNANLRTLGAVSQQWVELGGYSFDSFTLNVNSLSGGVVFIDNFAYSTAAVTAVPEPASWAVFSVGAVGLAF